MQRRRTRGVYERAVRSAARALGLLLNLGVGAGLALGCGLGAPALRAESGGLLERAVRGEARVVDLTQPLAPGIPSYGGEGETMRVETLTDLASDGYASGAFRVPEHYGTHVDAPGHFAAGGRTVDEIAPRRLLAPAVVIDVRARVRQDPDHRLTPAEIEAWERSASIPDGAAVLLLTGWGERFAGPADYRNVGDDGLMHFPGYSEAAVAYLLERRNVVALGIDTLSIDHGPSHDFAAHRRSHAAGLYHVENLANLASLPARGAFVIVAPLPVVGGSGSPARVLAIAPADSD